MMGENKPADFFFFFFFPPQGCQFQWFIMINYTATPAGASPWQAETWFLTLKWLIRAADGGGKQTLPVCNAAGYGDAGRKFKKKKKSAGLETRPPDVAVSLEIGQSIPLMLDRRGVFAVWVPVIFHILQWWCDRPWPGPICHHKSHSVKGW